MAFMIPHQRDRKGGRVLSSNRQKGPSRPANRVRMLATYHLFSRFRGRFPADAG